MVQRQDSRLPPNVGGEGRLEVAGFDPGSGDLVQPNIEKRKVVESSAGFVDFFFPSYCSFAFFGNAFYEY